MRKTSLLVTYTHSSSSKEEDTTHYAEPHEGYTEAVECRDLSDKIMEYVNRLPRN